MQNKRTEIDAVLLRQMFNTIRTSEIKNVKIEKFTDKDMAKRVAKYILEKVGEEHEV